MLLKILEIFKTEKILSDYFLTQKLNLDLAALQPMLDLCLKKGFIYCKKSLCQTHCNKCKGKNITYYQYNGD